MSSGAGTYAPQFSDLRPYHDKQHTVGFDGWWHCITCEARVPELNKRFCSAYTHKRWKNTHSDHTDQDSDGEYPGHKVRKEAYNIMVENQEEAQANRTRNT
eukprot:7371461-Heterocapsa_arctica.AAC.1